MPTPAADADAADAADAATLRRWAAAVDAAVAPDETEIEYAARVFRNGGDDDPAFLRAAARAVVPDADAERTVVAVAVRWFARAMAAAALPPALRRVRRPAVLAERLRAAASDDDHAFWRDVAAARAAYLRPRVAAIRTAPPYRLCRVLCCWSEGTACVAGAWFCAAHRGVGALFALRRSNAACARAAPLALKGRPPSHRFDARSAADAAGAWALHWDAFCPRGWTAGTPWRWLLRRADFLAYDLERSAAAGAAYEWDRALARVDDAPARLEPLRRAVAFYDRLDAAPDPTDAGALGADLDELRRRATARRPETAADDPCAVLGCWAPVAVRADGRDFCREHRGFAWFWALRGRSAACRLWTALALKADLPVVGTVRGAADVAAAAAAVVARYRAYWRRLETDHRALLDRFVEQTTVDADDGALRCLAALGVSPLAPGRDALALARHAWTTAVRDVDAPLPFARKLKNLQFLAENVARDTRYVVDKISDLKEAYQRRAFPAGIRGLCMVLDCPAAADRAAVCDAHRGPPPAPKRSCTTAASARRTADWP